MKKITVNIGSYTVYSNHTEDLLREVSFEGEELGSFETADDRHHRGTTETLYRTDDNRLVVHVNRWSQWQGEGDSMSLVEVIEDDLMPGGKYEFLGRISGFRRPLTLDEALAG